ncbi:hypothetical protein NPS53_08670 [Pseudomonas putida]|uniref:hypothetical protein n=1 Tax=Pseudomonas putida TaxID=303 RepID=UPI0023643AF6|nr:hypothetical protein [Pseudomonas putida]MDD2139646.1 hypothetical protein [Pseudomonas putida]HDS1721569.1 hypothetical protein [Pseudomonas putida]
MEEAASSVGLDSWPVPVQVHTANEKLVKLSELSKSFKVRAWGEIQSNSPALANLLKQAELKQIVDFFSASIYIEAHHAPCLPPERLRGRKA